MKLWSWLRNPLALRSLPSGGAWIEMLSASSAGSANASLPSGGAWIEMTKSIRSSRRGSQSLPSGGAWIEIMSPTPSKTA